MPVMRQEISIPEWLYTLAGSEDILGRMRKFLEAWDDAANLTKKANVLRRLEKSLQLNYEPTLALVHSTFEESQAYASEATLLCNENKDLISRPKLQIKFLANFQQMWIGLMHKVSQSLYIVAQTMRKFTTVKSFVFLVAIIGIGRVMMSMTFDEAVRNLSIGAGIFHDTISWSFNMISWFCGICWAYAPSPRSLSTHSFVFILNAIVDGPSSRTGKLLIAFWDCLSLSPAFISDSLDRVCGVFLDSPFIDFILRHLVLPIFSVVVPPLILYVLPALIIYCSLGFYLQYVQGNGLAGGDTSNWLCAGIYQLVMQDTRRDRLFHRQDSRTSHGNQYYL
ncbi:hypothetical protein H0H92_003060 [Tricholoma furcatifolium]|nr:hypothetical protein H0H92_003060 [Tricholoma furcatifolium]